MKVKKRIRPNTRLRKVFLGLCAAALIFSGVPVISLAEEGGASVNPSIAESAASANDENGSGSNEALGTIADDAASVQPSQSGLSESAEVIVSSTNSPSEDAGDRSALAGEIAPLVGSSLRSASGSAGTLKVSLSSSDGNFEDISAFTDQTVDWPIGELKTMRVDFEFGTGSDKSITITVPTGYQIVGYSALDDTASQDDLDNISIDPEYKGYFQSSSIVGVDGATKWEDQTFSSPYTDFMTLGEKYPRIYGGIVSYTFSDSTTRGLAVLTLQPQCSILAHTDTTELLDSITVNMDSTAGTLSQQFRANVTMLSEVGTWDSSSTWGYQGANVRYDPETQQSEVFGVLGCTSTYEWSSIIGGQNFWADEWVAEIDYPKGVSFANKLNLTCFGLGDIDLAEASIDPDHFAIEVTGDESTGGTVKLVFKKTQFYHSGGETAFGAYFTANHALTESDALTMPIRGKLTNHGQQRTWGFDYTRTLTADDGQHYQIKITAPNRSKRDINAEFPDFQHDYALGSFQLISYLPYENVIFRYDFTDLPGVRGIGAFGYDVHDIVATTTTGRTVEVASVTGKADTWNGVPVTPETLGLSDGEYLSTLTYSANLEQLTYADSYTVGFVYFGQFIDGQEGDVTVSVLDGNGDVATNTEGSPITATDHTTIRWEDCGGQWMAPTIYDSDWNEVNTIYPNDTINLDTFFSAGYSWTCDSLTTIDPIIMISLPKGINLDTSSVRARSTAGNHPYETMTLKQVGIPKTMTVDGIEWTTYYYTSENEGDIVEMEGIPGRDLKTFLFWFQAHVASNCPEYGQLDLADCIQFDLNKTSVKCSDCIPMDGKDTYNRTGKGTDYGLCEYSTNFTVKPLIGLNVDLGIRVKNSGTDFFTYDTTDSSIAPITKTKNAEVRISYENTASTDYFQGSSIFLPIPRIGQDYSKYFQNIELKDPLNKTTNTTFEFDTYLKSPVELDGFAAYYAVDVTENAEAYDPSTNAGTWEPVVASQWYTYDALSSSSYTLSDVIMVKLVASENIATGSSANGTFELGIDSNARIGQLDYWRAYSKALTDSENNTGVWNHSSVLAATPASDGLIGQIFVDSNNDGYFNIADGDTAYTAGNVTAILSRDDGTMANLALAVQPDGSFQSLNDNGTVYFLKSGDYTIAFANTDETYVFSPIAGAQHSDGTAWYNDLTPGDIQEEAAEYHFTIDESSELASYVGIALTDFVEVISVDVPVKVNIALNTNGTWCTPTALKNAIINRSTCAMHVASAVATTRSDFTLQTTSDFSTSGLENALAGTIAPANSAGTATGTLQDLTNIDTTGDKWTMPLGQTRTGAAVTDGSNELPLQLAGSIRSVEGHYFTAPINAFDITYTFEKAGE